MRRQMMWGAGPDLFPIFEGDAAVVGPGHLPDAGLALDALDAETGTNLAGAKVLDQLANRGAKRGLLLVGQAAKLIPESLGHCKRRYSARSLFSECSEELVGRVEDAQPPGGNVFVCFALFGLPFRGPEPGLVGVDLDRSHEDPLVGDLD
jgi:hypothetical protein